MKNANKHVLMAALAYNLKKYLKFISRKPKSNAQIMHLPEGILRLFLNRFHSSLITSI
ncbi:hypothetical protein LDL59_07225 [Kaistella anthropi]|nr:hypothetical protein [Kaistella anthropi]MCB4234962.1 hypothetical protein [Kaistella anthropi]